MIRIFDEYLFFCSTSMENREEKVNDIYEEIETNLKLIGATAIEDKLQDGVPECIERLARAGIKIWVLTGDKVETAYNIGLSCRLLTNDMEIQVIEEQEEKDVGAKLDEIRNEMINKIEQLFDVKIEDKKKRLDWKELGIDVMKFDSHRRVKETKPSANGHTEKSNSIDSNDQFDGFGMLITGQALTHALTDKYKMTFLELGTMCKAVVCCGVTPLQKAQVVELVMQNEKKITLAIGDGANDVSMIQRRETHLNLILSLFFSFL